MIKGIDNIRRIECCRDDNIRCVVILKRGEELETKRKNRMNKNGILITRQEKHEMRTESNLTILSGMLVLKKGGNYKRKERTG